MFVSNRNDLLNNLREDWEQSSFSPAQVNEELILFRLRGLSLGEIARVTSVPKSTVGDRLKRGQKTVQKMMMNKRESWRISDMILLFDSMIEIAMQAIHEARERSYDKREALKTAASMVMSKYRILRSLGLIVKPKDELEQFLKEIRRATLPQLEAMRVRLMHLIVG